jgi:hypothetical protein
MRRRPCCADLSDLDGLDRDRDGTVGEQNRPL